MGCESARRGLTSCGREPRHDPGTVRRKPEFWAGPGSAQACGGRAANLPRREARPVHTGHRKSLGTVSCSLLPLALSPAFSLFHPHSSVPLVGSFPLFRLSPNPLLTPTRRPSASSSDRRDAFSSRRLPCPPASALLCGSPLPVPRIPSQHHLPPQPCVPAAVNRPCCEPPGRAPRPPAPLTTAPPLVFGVLASLTWCPQRARKRQTTGLLQLLGTGSVAGGGPGIRPPA